MKTKVIGIGVGVACAVAIAAGFMLRPASEAPLRTGAMAPQALSPLALPVVQPDKAAAPTAAPAPAPAPVPQAGETRSAMLDRLSRGTPAQKFDAFTVLQACYRARAVEPNNPSPETRAELGVPNATREACDGILAGQETARLPLLAQAAEALVPGAARQVFNIRQSMSETDFEALFGRSVELNAAAGDRASLAILAHNHNAQNDAAHAWGLPETIASRSNTK